MAKRGEFLSMRGLYWLTVSAFLVVIDTSTVGRKVVKTLSGSVRGFTQNVDGVDVDIYTGIPFAEPPLGPLRFRAPRPVGKWEGVKSALTLPNSCMQSVDTNFNRFSGVEMWNPNTNVSEDCLYLNLWVPSASQGSKLTTLVWIYGGAFTSGSSTLGIYDGKYLSARKNVIVASMQYRLGVHGFLFSGTDEAPGNMGLLDQQMAMKWIHDNIEAFNGDKTHITLIGESAGSGSVSHHLLAPSSWHFFNNAIMLSGTSFGPWAWKSANYRINQFLTFAKVMGCESENNEEMIGCLRKFDAEKLEEKQWKLEDVFRPVIDGKFLTDTPENLMAAGKVKDTNIMLGNTKDEGEYFLLYQYPDIFPQSDWWDPPSINRSVYEDVVGRIVGIDTEVGLESILYTYEYSVLPSERPPFYDILDDIQGDTWFKCSVHDFADAFSSRRQTDTQTYVYSFEYRHSANPWPYWTGVMHGYEIEMVFGQPFKTADNHGAEVGVLSEFKYNTTDRIVSEHLMEYITTFAKTGSPNSQDVPTKWPEFDSDMQKHVVFTQDARVSVKQDFRHKECSFWKELFPKIRTLEDRQIVNRSGRFTASGIITLLTCVIVKMCM